MPTTDDRSLLAGVETAATHAAALDAVEAWPLALGSLHEDLAAAALALARRFSSGATLWCWSPAWPHHAQHVAVEFVHPVIMGKRALPAEAMTYPDPLGALRALTEPGDVLLAIADASDPAVGAAMRRAPAWGVGTIWLGVGCRPVAGAADHVLWLERAGTTAVYTGDVALLYHVLWELTHVCFEHSGLLPAPGRTGAGDGPAGRRGGNGPCWDDVCITCSDEGRLAEVVTAASGTATVRTASGREEIDTTLVGPVRAGDLVVVHAGAALELLVES